MGGEDPLRAELARVRDAEAKRRRIDRELRALERDFPDFRFGIITGHDGQAIEAVKHVSGEGLRAIIRRTPGEVRAVLDAALGHDHGP